MTQWQKWPWRVGWSMVIILMVPELALADNCSSLSDCWHTVLGGLGTALGIGIGLGASLLFGNGGGTPGPNVAPPQAAATAPGGAAGGGVGAVRGGTVTRVGWQNPNDHGAGLGWRVTITSTDGSGSYDQYGHMDPATTPAVGPISAGDPVGDYADPTNGHSTGPHVHHERRDQDGNIIDPGDVSPIPGGQRTSEYGQVDSAHPNPHQGNDWIDPTR